jgi:hypothetical protein
MARLQPSECPHENFEAWVKVGRMLDSGKFMAEITVSCTECDEPFRFVGVEAGLNFERPMVSIDGLELHAPIEPEGAKRLHASASYTMPEIPSRH